MQKRVLVTGADGFVGRALCRELENRGNRLREAVRSGAMQDREPAALSESKGTQTVAVGAIGPQTNWGSALADVHTVVHLAARVHVLRDTAADPLAEFRCINVAGTLNLACQAVDAGVRRFVFVSSIKVNGEGALLGQPYTADDISAPVDAYAISKHEAEEGLRRLAQETGLEVVIIRPVLIYGPGVKANFLSMMNWLYKRIPLPLGAIHNRRSFVALDNLVDVIVICLQHSAAANQTFLVSDGEDLSTTQLLRRLGLALGRPARLLPVPVALLRLCAAFLGKQDIVHRLCGSLQVDISKTRELLGWSPPVTVDEGLRRAAREFLDRRGT